MTLIQRDDFPTIGQATVAAGSAITYVPYGRAGHEEYKAAQQALENEFKELLRAEYASDFPAALHERIYVKAERDGHASGWESIENEYEESVLFAREVLKFYGLV